MNYEALKEGDSVAYYAAYATKPELRTVERLTATQIILSNNAGRFNRKTGRFVGESGYHSPRISEMTNEIRQKIKIRRLQSAIERFQVTPENMARVAEFLEAA